MNWFVENWLELIGILSGLIGVAEIVVLLTPTEKDNTVLDRIKSALSAVIPNLRKGGGVHGK